MLEYSEEHFEFMPSHLVRSEQGKDCIIVSNQYNMNQVGDKCGGPMHAFFFAMELLLLVSLPYVPS